MFTFFVLSPKIWTNPSELVVRLAQCERTEMTRHIGRNGKAYNGLALTGTYCNDLPRRITNCLFRLTLILLCRSISLTLYFDRSIPTLNHSSSSFFVQSDLCKKKNCFMGHCRFDQIIYFTPQPASDIFFPLPPLLLLLLLLYSIRFIV